MRAVIYARYSSDNQRDASIEDQVRECRARLEHEGWELANVYSDHGISGATILRPAYQQLLEDMRRGQFEVIVTEAGDWKAGFAKDAPAAVSALATTSIPAARTTVANAASTWPRRRLSVASSESMPLAGRPERSPTN